jgi:hypothetical protein
VSSPKPLKGDRTHHLNPPNYAYSKHPCLPGHGQRFTVCGPPVFSRPRHSACMALVSHRRLYRPPRITGAKLSNSKGQCLLKREFNLPRCRNIVSPTACSGHAACARCWTRASPTSSSQPFTRHPMANRRVILSPRVRRTSADTLVRYHAHGPLVCSLQACTPLQSAVGETLQQTRPSEMLRPSW